MTPADARSEPTPGVVERAAEVIGATVPDGTPQKVAQALADAGFLRNPDPPRFTPSENPAARMLSRRRFLFCQAVLAGAGTFLAIEAVASTALEHPEWDMTEERTWGEWERAS